MNKTIPAKRLTSRIVVGLMSLGLLSAAQVALANDVDGSKAMKNAELTPAMTANGDHVKSTAAKEVRKRRKNLDKEAVVANDEIHRAILALQKKDTRDAFNMLEKADGQLNVLMARDPHLKLAPIDVRASVYDLESSTKLIHHDVRKAEKDLEKGRIQPARALITPLVSELRIDTDYVPLGIYPDAIKRASREIQESRIKKAENTLIDATSSIVTIRDAIPLPPIKAEGDVLKADKLMKADSKKNKDEVLSLLKSADKHLANAQALGYGKYQDIRDEINALQSNIKSGPVKANAFERAKKMLYEFIHGHGPVT